MITPILLIVGCVWLLLLNWIYGCMGKVLYCTGHSLFNEAIHSIMTVA